MKLLLACLITVVLTVLGMPANGNAVWRSLGELSELKYDKIVRIRNFEGCDYRIRMASPFDSTASFVNDLHVTFVLKNRYGGKILIGKDIDRNNVITQKMSPQLSEIAERELTTPGLPALDSYLELRLSLMFSKSTQLPSPWDVASHEVIVEYEDASGRNPDEAELDVSNMFLDYNCN